MPYPVSVPRKSVFVLLVTLAATTVPVFAQQPTFEGLGRKDVDGVTMTCIPTAVTNNPLGDPGSGEVVYEPYVYGGVNESSRYYPCRWRRSDDVYSLAGSSGSVYYGTSFNAAVRVGTEEINIFSGETDSFREVRTSRRLLEQDVPNIWPNPLRFTPNILQQNMGISHDGRTVAGRATPLPGDSVETAGYVAEFGSSGPPNIIPLAFDANAVSGDGKVVVGRYQKDNVAFSQAAIWTKEDGVTQLIESPEGKDSWASDVSRSGHVVIGTSRRRDAPITSEAFRWSVTGGMQALGTLGTDYSAAYAVSGDGNRIVGTTGQFSETRAFLWTADDGMRPLLQVLEEDYLLDLTGWELREATAISDDGMVIVGTGLNPEGRPESWMAFLPTKYGRFLSAPATNFHIEVGTVFDLKWTSWDVESGQITFTADEPFDPSNYSGITVDVSPGDTLVEVMWTVPDTSTASGRLILEDANTLELLDIAGPFIIERAPPPPLSQVWIDWPDDPIAQDSVHTITWGVVQGEPKVTSVNIEYTVDPDFSPGNPSSTVYIAVPVATGLPVPTDTSEYVTTFDWTVPQDLSNEAYLIIYDPAYPEEYMAVSADFKIAGYHLRRTDSLGVVDLFWPSQHAWTFANERAELFPESWWKLPEFDYTGGNDPFRNAPYIADFDSLTESRADVFPDWPSAVYAFGEEWAYFPPDDPFFYWPSALKHWRTYHRGSTWGGSCAGLSITTLGTFLTAYEEDPDDRFGTYYPAIGSASSVNLLSMNPDIRRTINQIQVRWGQQPHWLHMHWGASKKPSQTLQDIKQFLFEPDVWEYRGYLYFAHVDTVASDSSSSGGAHAVVPYRLEKKSEDIWHVFVYDPNDPTRDDQYIEFDLSDDSWSYGFIGNGWGGTRRIFLMDDVTRYMRLAFPPTVFGTLFALTTPGANTLLTTPDGQRIGSIDGVDVRELSYDRNDRAPGEFIPPVGGTADAYGYWVPSEYTYSVKMTDAPDSTLSATFVQPGIIVDYHNPGADETSSDRLTYDDGVVTVSNDGEGGLSFWLETILTNIQEAIGKTGQVVPAEYVTKVDGVLLAPGDSVRVDAISAEGVKLSSFSTSPASYTLELTRISEAAQMRFRASNVQLDPGSIHSASPDWLHLDGDTLTIEIDTDGDGTTDETRDLTNEATNQSTHVDQPSPLQLSAAALMPGYPNPFRERAMIPFSLTEPGAVTIEVYDALGRRVAVLVDAVLTAGQHSATLSGTGLASGLYFVRLQADGVAETQALMLLRSSGR